MSPLPSSLAVLVVGLTAEHVVVHDPMRADGAHRLIARATFDDARRSSGTDWDIVFVHLPRVASAAPRRQ